MSLVSSLLQHWLMVWRLELWTGRSAVGVSRPGVPRPVQGWTALSSARDTAASSTHTAASTHVAASSTPAPPPRRPRSPPPPPQHPTQPPPRQQQRLLMLPLLQLLLLPPLQRASSALRLNYMSPHRKVVMVFY